jgi:AcrR family transcriptional regulator
VKGRVPRSVRERQLLEVAERVFAREGYQGASLEQVAQEAGVTRQYLNKLFGHKEGLYLACHARARAQLDAMLVEAGAQLPEMPTQDDARDVLRACVAAYFRFVRDHGDGWDVLFGAGAAVAGPAMPEVLRLRFATVRLLATLLVHAAPSIDPRDAEVFAHSLSGAGNQLAVWWRQTSMPLDEIVERFVALFWEGVRPYTRQP